MLWMTFQCPLWLPYLDSVVFQIRVFETGWSVSHLRRAEIILLYCRCFGQSQAWLIPTFKLKVNIEDKSILFHAKIYIGRLLYNLI